MVSPPPAPRPNPNAPSAGIRETWAQDAADRLTRLAGWIAGKAHDLPLGWGVYDAGADRQLHSDAVVNPVLSWQFYVHSRAVGCARFLTTLFGPPDEGEEQPHGEGVHLVASWSAHGDRPALTVWCSLHLEEQP